jgi:PIN domain nuclease of toxin-antitoxin system
MDGKIYILDACAVIAFLKDETGADAVENILFQAQDNLCGVIMNKINLLEVYYGFYYSDGKDYALKQLKNIMEMPVKFIDILSNATFYEAGRLKANYKISLADSILLAESIVNGFVVVSSDHHEFDIVEQNENIKFLWFR